MILKCVYMVSNLYEICKRKTCCIPCFKKIPDQPNHQILEASGLINPGRDFATVEEKAVPLHPTCSSTVWRKQSRVCRLPNGTQKSWEYCVIRGARGLSEMSEHGTASGWRLAKPNVKPSWDSSGAAVDKQPCTETCRNPQDGKRTGSPSLRLCWNSASVFIQTPFGEGKWDGSPQETAHWVSGYWTVHPQKR